MQSVLQNFCLNGTPELKFSFSCLRSAEGYLLIFIIFLLLSPVSYLMHKDIATFQI